MCFEKSIRVWINRNDGDIEKDSVRVLVGIILGDMDKFFSF